MATRRIDGPAGRNVGKDSEVKSAHHDEVLFWLIENLANLVGTHWGLHRERFERELARARRVATQWVERSAAKEFTSYADGSEKPTTSAFDRERGPSEIHLGDQSRSALRSAVARAPVIAQAILEWPADPDMGRATLRSYEAMKPVGRFDLRSHLPTKHTDAGYVDLAAQIFVPNAIGFSIEGLARIDGSRSCLGYLYNEDDLMKAANAFSPSGIRVEATGQPVELWISVRTGTFTLGEVLQELKTLRALERGAQEVALVADGLDARLRAQIQHEGFVVFDRADYREAKP